MPVRKPPSIRAHTHPTPSAQCTDVSRSGRKGSRCCSSTGCSSALYSSSRQKDNRYAASGRGRRGGGRGGGCGACGAAAPVVVEQ